MTGDWDWGGPGGNPGNNLDMVKGSLRFLTFQLCQECKHPSRLSKGGSRQFQAVKVLQMMFKQPVVLTLVGACTLD